MWVIFSAYAMGLVLIFCECHTALWHDPVLPTELIQSPLIIQGYVVSLPKRVGKPLPRQSFIFQTDEVNHARHHWRLRLSWYNSSQQVNLGEQWRFTVRLKPAHGLKNIAGFDYGQWLFVQHIMATGSVYRRGLKPLKIAEAHAFLSRFRAHCVKVITGAIQNTALSSIIVALSVGSRSEMSQSTWRVFQKTGTSHLVAISGLHVGFVVTLVFYLAQFIWRYGFGLLWSGRCLLWLPASRFAGIVSLCAAIAYGLLAGWSLPTERAVLMLCVLVGFECVNQTTSLSERLALSLTLILMWQPRAVLSVSFWLSSLAVFWIVVSMSACAKPLRGWRASYKLQIAITAGLAPVMLYTFQQLSLVVWPANFIAIPVVTFLLVPICFIACLVLLVNHAMASALFVLAGKILWPLWWVLVQLAGCRFAIWHHGVAAMWVMIMAELGVAVWLLPLPWMCRFLGSLLWLPTFYYYPTVNYGAFGLVMLDVGQGLSVLIKTKNHSLLFDAGPKSFGGFDAGKSVVLATLWAWQIHSLDRMIISHGDNDHIGGAYSVLKYEKVDSVLTSVPNRFKPGVASHCYAGEHWVWDGVLFKVLYPEKGMQYAGNDSSCVLLIVSNQHSALLTGDIEASAERWLLARHLVGHVDLITAPHHGSKTSSTLAFVQAAHPKRVLYATGFYNRYHFPSPSVVARYKAVGAGSQDTAKKGAILWNI